MSQEVLIEGGLGGIPDGFPHWGTTTVSAEAAPRSFQIISGVVGFGIDGKPPLFPASVQQLPGKLHLERPVLANNQQVTVCLEVEKVDSHEFRIRAEGGSPMDEEVVIESVELFSGIFPGQDLSLTTFGEQSWSEAQAMVPFDPENLKLPYPVKNSVPPREGVVICPEAAQISIDGDQPLLFGFLGAQEQQGMIFIEKVETGFKVTASVMAEKRPRRNILTETLIVLTNGSWNEQVQRYSRVVAAEVSAKPDVPAQEPVIEEAMRVYYSSWYFWFDRIRSENVDQALPALQALAEEIPELQGMYFVIDDGWQDWIEGEWDENDKFPEGMAALFRKIEAAGFKPGIWIAPMMANEHSRVTKEHPDWLVKDKAGAPLWAKHNWGGDNYVLDITHPEVETWYRQKLRKLKLWGVKFIKFDFLYGIGREGVYFDPTMTSAQAYRRFLDITEEELGEEIDVNLCGAPLLGSARKRRASARNRWSYRGGSDTLERWHNGLNQDGSESSMPAVARTLIARHQLGHEVFDQFDLDVLILREGDFSPEERQTLVNLYLLLSNNKTILGIGDHLSVLEPDWLDVYRRIFPLPKRGGEILPPLRGGLPGAMRLGLPEHKGGGGYIGLFNFEDEAKKRSLNLRHLKDESERYAVTDAWTGEFLGLEEDAIGLQLDPHSSRLLLATPLRDKSPSLIGLTGHLLGKEVHLVNEVSERDRFSLELTRPVKRGEALILIPPGLMAISERQILASEVEYGYSLLKIPLSEEGKRIEVEVCPDFPQRPLQPTSNLVVYSAQ